MGGRLSMKTSSYRTRESPRPLGRGWCHEQGNRAGILYSRKLPTPGTFVRKSIG